MTTANVTVKMAAQSTYGAVEVKEFIRKYTYIGFGLTVAIFIAILAIWWGINKAQQANDDAKRFLIPKSSITMDQYAQDNQAEAEIAPPPQDMKIEYATAQKAGNPVPVTDLEIIKDLKEFATMDQLDQSLSANQGIEVSDLNSVLDNANLSDKSTQITTAVESLPEDGVFMEVESEPNVDLEALMKKIVYPETARRAGVEGRVIVRVLVGKDGKPIKSKIQSSESSLLENAALEAVNKTSFVPAIQNGSPTTCWVSIPIQFRLK
jgi:protein TonB